MTMPHITESLCPHCLRRIEARRVRIGSSVYLEKTCPEHGRIDGVLIWKDYPWTFETWDRPRPAGWESRSPAGIEEPKGCPFDCGICRNHQQATCTAILEVTHDCNLNCAVCFASSTSGHGAGPGRREIGTMLEYVKETRGICPIQLSGGEPTVRDDLPQIVALARRTGFDHIQINTNGVRIARELEYARALVEAGATDFFLQFDGLTDEVYLRMRRAPLLELKIRALEHSAQLKIGVILVPTIAKNINDNQIGLIIRFAKKWIPTVKGVHFQPMTYLGRYPDSPGNDDRILIPDILAAIEEQMEGELAVENMVPPG